MSELARAALARFRARQAVLEADLADLVRIESPSDDPAAVTAVAERLKDRLIRGGVAAELRECPPRGAALLAHVGEGSGGTLLLGHHDTVCPIGTLAERPFSITEGRARGPGCFDMKSGLAVAIAVLEALTEHPFPPRVTLLSVPDEEVGSEASRELLLATARRVERVLVLEPSADGAAKVARKGTGQFELRFHGRSSHAGLDPEKGASALAELARAVLFVESLGDAERGTTVTPTVARAGTVVNVVPEHASLLVDARVWSLEESERVERALRGRAVADPRVACEVLGGFDRPPLESTPEADALYERARGVAELLGGSLGAARVGGASDGNLTAAAGVTTLDGLGPRGGGAHAPDEWVDVADLPFRAALLLGLVGGY